MPICKHFQQCGGCQLQHLAYSKQLEIKKKIVEYLVKRKIDKIIPSPKIFYYRNKMDYSIDQENGKIIVGLREKGKWWKVVDLEECYLMSKEANQIKNLFREFANRKKLSVYDKNSHKGLLRYLVIREGKFTNQRMVVINTSSQFSNKEDLHSIFLEFFDILKSNSIKITSFLHGINDSLSDISLSFQTFLLKGNRMIVENLNGINFLINENSFFQTNSYTANLMIKEVEKIVKNLDKKILIDLFAGTGTFSIPFYKIFEKIIAIEAWKENTKLYIQNLKINGISLKKFEIIEKKVEEIKFNFDKNSLVIVDPPRQGLSSKTIKLLNKSEIDTLIYISCNPLSFSKNLSKLNFKIQKLILVDQFPNTWHVELISLLKKINLTKTK
ncbi:MAG: 23S rRNA (uracil(1939)-C(5))-methyltransferase RlmD [Candidatus Aenigmarchaeota archaeon ex4484_224]|nr:MAG: 23S rRNA (uracil(1939)-C(5))-methyltransferase RlmD [Candidatus Aenigmarchaeota archaeon ex4484_224]